MRPHHPATGAKGRRLSSRTVALAIVFCVCVFGLIWTVAAFNASTIPPPTASTAPTTTTSAPTSSTTSTPSTSSTSSTSTPPPALYPVIETDDPFTGALENIPLPPDWYECVRRFLRLDAAGMPTQDVLSMHGAIPVLITPLTGDTRFLPRFVCSIDVPVRYYVVILNERDTATVNVVDELQRRFGDSGRLIVRRNHHNRGYSGSMNQGVEWAMTERSNEQAPWFFACNVDIVFGNHILRDMVELIAAQTTGDAAMLAALREEVEMEQRLVEEGNFSYYERYVPRGRPLKVLRSGYPGVPLNVRTAPLLPDRIRYMHANTPRPDGHISPQERKARYFGNYSGTFTPVIDALGTIALTRLFVSTVGYFDENYFPAYMDDIDMQWRMYAFGFSRLHAGQNPAGRRVWYHYNAANMRGVPEDDLVFKRSNEDNMSRHAFLRYLTRRGDNYDVLKYGIRDRHGVWRQTPEKSNYAHMFFNVSHYPLDTWVLDDEVRACMFRKTYDYERRTWTRPDRCIYRASALRDSGVLGVDQVESLPR